MKQMADGLQSGDMRELTVRQILPPAEPGKYDAAKVRATRHRLHVSQAVFAQLLGISIVLSQSWEQGSRKPSKLACRLLDEINADPDRWRQKLRAA
jgi:putative transcriptional regulator